MYVIYDEVKNVCLAATLYHRSTSEQHPYILTTTIQINIMYTISHIITYNLYIYCQQEHMHAPVLHE